MWTVEASPYRLDLTRATHQHTDRKTTHGGKIDLNTRLRRANTIYTAKPYSSLPSPRRLSRQGTSMSTKSASSKKDDKHKKGSDKDKPKEAKKSGEMATPDFANAKAVKGADCEIKCKGGSVLYCHRDILGVWSPLCSELFQSEDARREDSVSIELSDHEADDVKTVLAICYPPNASVTDKTVYVVLPIARDLQIQDITRRCQEFLCKKKGKALDLDKLVTAQEYKLPDLEEKVVTELAKTPFSGVTDSHPSYKQLQPETAVRLLQKRLQYLEELVASVDKRQSIFDNKFAEMLKMFSDIAKAMQLNSANAGAIRDVVLTTADRAMDEISKPEPAMEKPYSDYDGAKAAKEEADSKAKEEPENSENKEGDAMETIKEEDEPAADGTKQENEGGEKKKKKKKKKEK